MQLTAVFAALVLRRLQVFEARCNLRLIGNSRKAGSLSCITGQIVSNSGRKRLSGLICVRFSHPPHVILSPLQQNHRSYFFPRMIHAA